MKHMTGSKSTREYRYALKDAEKRIKGDDPRTREECQTEVEVTVCHSTSGTYRACIHAYELTRGSTGFTFKRFTINGELTRDNGLCARTVEKCDRYSFKRLTEIAEKVDEVVLVIASLWLNDRITDAVALLEHTIGNNTSLANHVGAALAEAATLQATA
jgi:hypothetical protein